MVTPGDPMIGVVDDPVTMDVGVNVMATRGCCEGMGAIDAGVVVEGLPAIIFIGTLGTGFEL